VVACRTGAWCSCFHGRATVIAGTTDPACPVVDRPKASGDRGGIHPCSHLRLPQHKGMPDWSQAGSTAMQAGDGHHQCSNRSVSVGCCSAQVAFVLGAGCCGCSAALACCLSITMRAALLLMGSGPGSHEAFCSACAWQPALQCEPGGPSETSVSAGFHSAITQTALSGQPAAGPCICLKRCEAASGLSMQPATVLALHSGHDSTYGT